MDWNRSRNSQDLNLHSDTRCGRSKHSLNPMCHNICSLTKLCEQKLGAEYRALGAWVSQTAPECSCTCSLPAPALSPLLPGTPLGSQARRQHCQGALLCGALAAGLPSLEQLHQSTLCHTRDIPGSDDTGTRGHSGPGVVGTSSALSNRISCACEYKHCCVTRAELVNSLIISALIA